MAIRWQFVEDPGKDSQWAWRTVRADDAIDKHSGRFATYGLAMIDAIRNGFQPREEPWLVITSDTITHFHPGRKPMSMPVAADSPATREILLSLRAPRDTPAPKKKLGKLQRGLIRR